MFGIFSSQECTLRLLVLNVELVRQKVAHCRRKPLLFRCQRISLQTPTTKSTTKNEACEIFLVIEFQDAIWRCSMFYLFICFFDSVPFSVFIIHSKADICFKNPEEVLGEKTCECQSSS